MGHLPQLAKAGVESKPHKRGDWVSYVVEWGPGTPGGRQDTSSLGTKPVGGTLRNPGKGWVPAATKPNWSARIRAPPVGVEALVVAKSS